MKTALGPAPGSTGGRRRASPRPAQTRVDGLLSSPQRVDVGVIDGQAGRDLGTCGDGAVAGEHDIGLPGGRALRRHRLRPLSGLTGHLGGGGGGVARHVAEPGMPEQVVPVGMG